jgi:Zn-dependent oligopeptidase
MRATNSIPLGCQLPLIVSTINCVETLKAMRQQIFASTYAVEERHAHVFSELLRQRAELAQLVGYASFGHKVRCAFSTEIYTRGCLWIPRMFA